MLRMILEPVNEKTKKATITAIIDNDQFADFCLAINSAEYKIFARNLSDNSTYIPQKKESEPKEEDEVLGLMKAERGMVIFNELVNCEVPGRWRFYNEVGREEANQCFDDWFLRVVSGQYSLVETNTELRKLEEKFAHVGAKDSASRSIVNGRLTRFHENYENCKG